MSRAHALLVLLFCSLLSGSVSPNAVFGQEEPSTAKLGQKIQRLELSDAAGRPWSLQGLKGSKAIVVVFFSFECPVAASYSATLADLQRTFGPRGVAFVGICSRDEGTPAEMARKAREGNLPFPVLVDRDCTAVETFKAEVAPEVFVLDEQRLLRYRGRIDNSYAARLKRNARVTQHDLRRALEEVLAGKVVTTPATSAVGCPLVRKLPPVEAAPKVTYHRDVLPILQNHCQSCHRPGGGGPFALTTYKQAVNWAADIEEFTRTRKMPPWKPVAGAEMHNERKLSNEQIKTLAAWIQAGAPPGEPKDAPAARQFPEGWQLGEPDLVLTLPEDFQLGPTGGDCFRGFALPTSLTEDRHITAIEIRPGNPRIVHHVVLVLDAKQRARENEKRERERPGRLSEPDRGPGYWAPLNLDMIPNLLSGPWPLLAAWTPGQIPRKVPEGMGYFLPKGSDILMQVHYSRTGRVEKDRTSVGLHFAKKPLVRRIEGFGVPGPFLVIPAGAARQRVAGSVWVPRDCTIHSIFPHMHLIGREIQVTMTAPGEPPRTLLRIEDWDFNWQETYFFKKPLDVPAGTRFDVEAFFDNSAKNLANPYQPPRPIFPGLETTNEMCAVLLEATSERPGRIWPLPFSPLWLGAKK